MINISMNFKTDGDIDFHNIDFHKKEKYLDSSWEHYSKTIIVKEDMAVEAIFNLINYLKENAYNVYNQHQGLVNFVKELDIKKIFKLNENFNIDDMIGYHQILNGNQDFNICISKFNEEKVNKENKIKNIALFKELYEKLKNEKEIIDFLKR